MSQHSAESDEDMEEGLLTGRHKPSLPSVQLRRMLWRMLPIALLIAFVVFLLSPSSTRRINPGLPEHTDQNWAQYSPYVPQAVYGVPAGCAVTQVNILQRHGARYPTSGASERIVAALHKILSVKHYTDAHLQFLTTFKYNLGENDLLAFGADQSYESGEEAFNRYSSLFSVDNIPFVRASSAERVVLSATNWSAGFAAASDQLYNPPLAMILSEAGNDTLDDKMCPAAGSADAQTATWLASYAPPITARLNAGAPGANLTDADTFSLISLCPFESVAKGHTSPFCTLFGDTDVWAGFAYSGDLDKYYGTGYGEPLGRVQGVGYVNELLARLTDTPVRDRTQTNRTLDASPDTFPLGRALYADFSHDNAMVAIFAALGLFRQESIEPLDAAAPHPDRRWRVGRMVPFSGRMVVERLACRERAEPVVRILVNDQVQPLAFCDAGEDGMCNLSAFVESQAYARSDGAGDWEKCFQGPGDSDDTLMM